MDAPFPIDFVIPWVDGSDPVLGAVRSRYLTPAAASDDAVAGPTRYASDWEIVSCVASILRFAPFAKEIERLTIWSKYRSPILSYEIRHLCINTIFKLPDIPCDSRSMVLSEWILHALYVLIENNTTTINRGCSNIHRRNHFRLRQNPSFGNGQGLIEIESVKLCPPGESCRRS